MARLRSIAGVAILVIAVAGLTPLMAQSPEAVPSATTVKAINDNESEPKSIRLLAGRSILVDPGAPIARVSLTNDDVADAVLTGSAQLLVHGKVPGAVSMFVWERTGAIQRYEITVSRDLGRLTDQMKQLFPGEPLAVDNNGKTVVLSGRVSSKDVADRAISLATGFVDKKEDVVNLLQLPEARSNQVLLRVRFAEVTRSALTELALSAAANGYKNGRWFGRVTTEQFAAPQWDASGKFVFSDFLNLFLFDTKNQLATVIKALQTRGLFQSLAEPNLVAESGKEASFLAGGEFPVPVPQGAAGTVIVTIAYKEFGIRLNFTPVVNGNRVHLKVRPEVSTLDFGNAIQLNGFKIPALSTRRTETELELENNQTFAIAGLINNQMTRTLEKIPGIGDIPILGLLFQSKAAQKEQTELVVMITPVILPLSSPGVTPDLPRLQEPYLPPLLPNKSMGSPPPAFPSTSNRQTGEKHEPTVASASPIAGFAAGSAVPSPTGAAPVTANADPPPLSSKVIVPIGPMPDETYRDVDAQKSASKQVRKQHEVEKKHQQALTEAEAKLKAAQAAYAAELAKAAMREEQIR